MDAKKLQRAYVSMLYSETYRIEGAVEEYKYLDNTMDKSRLLVERAARQRNLRTVLYSDMSFVPRYFSKEKILELVIDYCESDSFWNWNSRTLIESFCIFIFRNSNLSEEEKVIFLIDGVYSGISTKSEQSPWESTLRKVSDISISEEVVLNRKLSLKSLKSESEISKLNFSEQTSSLKLLNENGKVTFSLKEYA